MSQSPPKLFTPLALRSLQARNRIVISPMCQYSAIDGMPNDWHLAHLGRFATGGAGIVFVEATGVEERGRITHHDLGIWKDEHVEGHRRIVSFLKAHGAATALQVAHAGRKASTQRPWEGGAPLGAEGGENPWPTVGPSPVPTTDAWPTPHPLSTSEIADLIDRWTDAARRALAADYDILEIHGAHGYLICSFLSPISNHRNDAYGGDRSGRMRFALEVTEAIRAVWPEDRPLFFRASAIDGADGGWSLDDTVVLAKELKARGVDVIDCSSGGIAGSPNAPGLKRKYGFQVPYAETVRREANIMTQAVGLITNPHQAEEILQQDQADLIAIGREALREPFWPRRAAETLGYDPEFGTWPDQYGWWLARRAESCVLYGETAS